MWVISIERVYPPIGSGHMNSSVAFSPTKGNLTSVNKVEALTISILQTPSRHIRIRMPTFEIYLRTKIKPNQVQIKNMRFLFPAQESQKHFKKCSFFLIFWDNKTKFDRSSNYLLSGPKINFADLSRIMQSCFPIVYWYKMLSQYLKGNLFGKHEMLWSTLHTPNIRIQVCFFWDF